MVARQRPRRRRSVGPPGHPSHTTSREQDVQAKHVTNPNERLAYPEPSLGERYYFNCPLCGDGNADATYKRDNCGQPRWFVGCKSVKCEALGGGYLRALGAKLGTTAWSLLEDPRLAVKTLPSSGRRTSAAGTGADLPSPAEFAGWSRRLRSEPEPLRW